jgi:hypothetical protein
MKKNSIDPAQTKDIFTKLTIEDLDIKGKRVFIRADFNVPLDNNLMITDDRRIRSTLPTINYAIDEGQKSYSLLTLGGRKERRIRGSVLLRLQNGFSGCSIKRFSSLLTASGARQRILSQG